MTVRQVALAAVSISAVGLIFYGKYRLALARPTLIVLLLGGLVFMASTPAAAE